MKVFKDRLLRLSNWLIVLMTALIVLSMLILFQLIEQNKNDGSLINTSGRQRYLSQKLTKTSILYLNNADLAKDAEYIQAFKEDLLQYKTNNEFLLKNTNSELILNLLNDIQPKFDIIYNNAEALSKNDKNSDYLNKILDIEPHFLKSMNTIVLQYERENIKAINDFLFYLGFVDVLLIVALVFFIYSVIRPAIINNKKYQNIISDQNTELVKLNNNKNIFINVLAHDLRSPFGGILGLLNILEENIHTFKIEDIKTQIKVTNDTAKRVYNLLERLLSWARLQAGKMPFSPQKIQLSLICEEIMELNEINAKNKNIKLQNFVHQDIEVYADKDMLSAILRNLISNSIKFTNNLGSIKINATVNEANILVSVSDTGIGMDEETKNKLFDISNMFTTPGTSQELGSGLGLLLCKDFVSKHEGEIWVESEIGKGSDFKFTIPVQKD